MTLKLESPADDGRAFECLAGRLDTLERTENRQAMQCAPGSDGAIAGSLDPQAIRVELSERERERGDCVPVIRRLHAVLAEAEVALIDPDDTVDTRRRDRRRVPEFVGLTARE